MRWAALALAAVGTLAGCGDLAFRRDTSLHFTTPAQRAHVRLPVVISWRIAPRRFTAVGLDGSSDPHRGAFGIFVDRAPLRPGHDIVSLAQSDPYCAGRPGCPSREWLAAHGVYVTRRPGFALRTLPPDSGRRVGEERRHEVTVVLLDGRSRRVGEASWTRTFYLPDPGA